MSSRFHIVSVLIALAAVGLVVSAAMADPLPGEKVKFVQAPMGNTLPDGTQTTLINNVMYFGHDELSTARLINPGTTDPPLFEGTFMADDFADPYRRPVGHVKWWGSYLPQTEPSLRVQRFLISFETDIPANPNEPESFSRPGTPLLSQIVTLGPLAPGSGTFTEQLVNMGGLPNNEALYEYNAELMCPFAQEPDTVYWLKIVALVGPDEPIQWGWHNRDYTIKNPHASPLVLPGERVVGVIPDPTGATPGTPIYHFQDDAVTGNVKILYGGHPCEVYVEQGGLMRPTSYVNWVDGPGPIDGTNFPGIGAYSKDLAFALFTPVPEPSTCALLTLGLASLAVYRWRRR